MHECDETKEQKAKTGHGYLPELQTESTGSRRSELIGDSCSRCERERHRQVSISRPREKASELVLHRGRSCTSYYSAREWIAWTDSSVSELYTHISTVKIFPSLAKTNLLPW